MSDELEPVRLTLKSLDDVRPTGCVEVEIGGTGAKTPDGARVNLGLQDSTSGVMDPARIGIGTPSETTYLRGDGVWAPVTNELLFIDQDHVVGLVDDLAAKSPLAGSDALTTVGTITVGVWQGSRVTVDQLGTGTPAAGKYLDGAGAWADLPTGGGGGPLTGNGSAITNLNASALATGTATPARLGSGATNNTTVLYGDGVWRAAPTGSGGGPLTGDGSAITNLNASALALGMAPTARLGSGTASNSTVLYGDNVWRPASVGGATSPLVLGPYDKVITDPPYNAKTDGTDCTPIIQQCIDDAVAARTAASDWQAVIRIVIPASSGSFSLHGPIYVESNGVEIHGVGDSSKLYAAYEGFPVFIFGEYRAQPYGAGYLTPTAANRPDAHGVLDNFACSATGQKWGFRTLGKQYGRFMGSPPMCGIRVEPDSYFTNPNQSDNWGTVGTLTLEWMMVFPAGKVTPQSPIFGMWDDFNWNWCQFAVRAGGSDNQVYFSFRTRDIRDGEYLGPGAGNYRHCYAGVPPGGTLRMALQLDCAAKTVTFFANGKQLTTVLAGNMTTSGSEVYPWTDQGNTLATNDSYPFTLGYGNAYVGSGSTNGDIIFYGIRASKIKRYQENGPATDQVKVGGGVANDHDAYFTDDANTIFYYPFNNPPGTDRKFTVQAGGAAFPMTCFGTIEETIESPGMGNQGVYDLEITTQGNYGIAVLKGKSLEFTLENVTAISGYCAYVVKPGTANYWDYINECRFSGADSCVTLWRTLCKITNLNVVGSGRVTVRAYASTVLANDIFVERGSQITTNIVKVSGPDYGGAPYLKNVLIDYEGDVMTGPVAALFYVEAIANVGMNHLVLDGCGGASVKANACFVRLRDMAAPGSGGFGPAVITMIGCMFTDPEAIAVIEIDGDRWHGDLENPGYLQAQVLIRHTQRWSTDCNITIHDWFLGAPPTAGTYLKGGYVVHAAHPGATDPLGWFCTGSGTFGSGTDPVFTPFYAGSTGGGGGGPLTGDGSAITNLNASALALGMTPAARLGSGTASNSTVLYGDNVWRSASVGGSTSNLVLSPFDRVVTDPPFNAVADSTTDCTAAFQACVDAVAAAIAGSAGGYIRGIGRVIVPPSPAGQGYIINKPIYVDHDNIWVVGADNTSQLYSSGGFPAFIFGEPRKQPATGGTFRTVGTGNRPDAYQILDNTACQAHGQKWGFRTLNTHWARFIGSPPACGVRVAADSYFTNPSQSDNWGTVSQLTLEFFVRFPIGKLPIGAPICGIVESYNWTYCEFYVQGGGDNQLMFAFRTSDMADGESLTGSGNYRIARADTPTGGVLRVAIQLDCTARTVTFFANKKQLTTYPANLSTNMAPDSTPWPWTAGTTLATSDGFPFTIGAGAPYLDQDTTGVDLEIYGLRASNIKRYQENGPNTDQLKVGGGIPTDQSAYFANDANTIFYLPFTDPPTESREITVYGGNAAWPVTCYGMIKESPQDPGLGNQGVENVLIQTQGNYGIGVQCGRAMEFTIEGVTIWGGSYGLLQSPSMATYYHNINNCDISANDSALFLWKSINNVRDLAVPGSGRVTVRCYQAGVTIFGMFVGRGSQHTTNIVKLTGGGYSKGVIVYDLLVDYEGDQMTGPVSGTFFFEAPSDVALGMFTLVRCFGGSVGPDSCFLRLRDMREEASPNFMPCNLIVENCGFGGTGSTPAIEIDGNRSRADIQHFGDFFSDVPIRHLERWSTDCNIMIHDRVLNAVPTTGAWVAGGHFIHHSTPDVGEPLGWICTGSGTFGSGPNPVFEAVYPSGSGGGATSPLTLTATVDAEVPLSLAGHSASQAGNLLEARRSAGDPLAASISRDGTGMFAGVYHPNVAVKGVHVGGADDSYALPGLVISNGTAGQNIWVLNNSGVYTVNVGGVSAFTVSAGLVVVDATLNITGGLNLSSGVNFFSGASFSTNTDAGVPFVVRGHSATQTGNLVEFYRYNGGPLVAYIAPSGEAVFTGTMVEATTVPGVHLGMAGGTPRIIFADGTGANWEIDTAGGMLRFLIPGAGLMNISTQTLTLDGLNIIAGAASRPSNIAGQFSCDKLVLAAHADATAVAGEVWWSTDTPGALKAKTTAGVVKTVTLT